MNAFCGQMVGGYGVLHIWSFPLPFLNNCLSSSVDHRGVSACGGLGTSWWCAGRSYGEAGVWYQNSALSISVLYSLSLRFCRVAKYS